MTDPTGGETARAIRTDPTLAEPVLDPTDPRYGQLSPQTGESEAGQILDPTDPACSERRI
jgi:hypothetical protein